MNRLIIALIVAFIVVCVRTSSSDADDQCLSYARELAARNTKVGTAFYWTGAQATPLKGVGTTPPREEAIYYFSPRNVPTAKQLALPDDKVVTPGPEQKDPRCGDGLLSWIYKSNSSQQDDTPQPAKTVSLDDYVHAYRRPPDRGFMANSATSAFAAEAAQILGQIVVDRASQAAYSLITRKAEQALTCAGSTRFPATCQALDALRLQDLAMAPDLLRAALVSDAFGFIDISKKKAIDAPNTKDGSADAPSAPGTACPAKDTRCEIAGAIPRAISAVVIPVLGRPVSALTGHPAQMVVQQLVDKGLDKVLDKVEGAVHEQICKLPAPDRLLALAGAAFAVCQVRSTTIDQSCDIMNVVAQFDQGCSPHLPDYHLAYAQSIASHFWQAVSLMNTSRASDDTRRLVAGLEGTFEVACMYAPKDKTKETIQAAGPYKCEIDPNGHKDGRPLPLQASESVAIGRDVVLAAANRDGAALATTIIGALLRILPTSDDKQQARGVRLLGTITAYAATYTGADASSADAHQRRTALLESLTRDMTNRTDRGGDTIASFGGSLRLVLGGRISRARTEAGNTQKRDYAVWGPLSLPLGFGLDVLGGKPAAQGSDARGFHMDLGILDLGQYLSFDGGAKLETPDVTSAFAPSLTLSYAFGRELPFIVGVTGGFTPAFDFDPKRDDDKRGAWMVGFTAGVYIPLFDFN